MGTGEEASDISEEAEGLGSTFAKTLGVTDIIFGALSLYGLRLLSGTKLTVLFPSTGYTFVDIGLLACAAAFAGKIVGLATALLSAVVGIFFEYRSTRYHILSEIVNNKDEYERIVELRIDVVDQATHLVMNTQPKQAARIAEIEARVALCYSGTLVGLLYLSHLFHRQVQWEVKVGSIACLVALFVYGFVYQLDHLTALLLSLKERPRRTDKPREDSMEFIVKTKESKLSAHHAARLLSSLVVIGAALELSDLWQDSGLLRSLKDLNQEEISNKGLPGLSFKADAPDLLGDRVIQSILRRSDSGKSLVLDDLKGGSARGILQGGVRRIIEVIGGILDETLKSPEQALGIARRDIQLSNAPLVTKNIAAGIAAIGIAELSNTFRQMAAISVDVKVEEVAPG